MSRRLLWCYVAAGALLSLAVSYKIATQSFYVGSDEGRWVYPYFWPFAWHSLVVLAWACSITFATCALPLKLLDRHEWMMVAAWLVAALLVQAVLRGLTPFTFEQMFASDGANSFYNPTKQYSTTTLLTTFDQLRPTFQLHAQSNMPGKVILVSLLRQLSDRPAVLAWLIVLISNVAGGVLLYLFVRDLFEDRRTALFALILYLLFPAKLYFFPLLNTVTPVAALACAFLLQRWLRTRRVVYSALLGVALYLLVFFDPLPLVLGLLFAFLLARAWISEPLRGKSLLSQGGMAIVAFAATYVLFLTIFRFDLLATFRATQVAAAAFNATVQRPYEVWVGANLIEFAFGTGISQALIFCAIFIVAAGRSALAPLGLSAPIVALVLGLGSVLIAVDLSGANRGEVTRLWIFLAAFFQIPAAYACAQLQNRAALMVILGVTLLQAALGTSMIAFVLP